jgi:ParB-like chromosome segregation protein Spo0J
MDKVSNVIKELVLIRKEKLLFGNTHISKDKVDSIVANLNVQEIVRNPILIYKIDEKYLVTDGNHRAKALMEKGYKEIPALLLTREEFMFIGGTENTILFKFQIPKKVNTIK